MPRLGIVIDAAVLVVCALVIYRGYRKGLINQVVWLLSIAVGYLVGSRFASSLADVIRSFIKSDTTALAVSFVALVLGTILLMRMIGRGITRVLSFSVAGVFNSVLGAALDGLLLLVVLLIGLNVTVLVVPGTDRWVQDTVLIQRLAELNHMIGDQRLHEELERTLPSLQR